jgi:hypothetical protein
MTVNNFRDYIIKLITAEKEILASYRNLCANYQIKPDAIPEAIALAKVNLLNDILKNLDLTLKNSNLSLKQIKK